jgi:hypothetical protein
MRSASGTLSRVLGALLAILAATQVVARAAIPERPPATEWPSRLEGAGRASQEPAALGQAAGEQESSPPSNHKSEADSQKVNPGAAGQQADNEQGPDASPTTKAGKPHGKPAQVIAGKSASHGQDSLRRVARQVLDNLDTAINVANTSGAFGPSMLPGEAGNDIAAQRDALGQMASAATDDATWADVAIGASATLKETLIRIQANSNNRTEGGTAGMNHAKTSGAGAGGTFMHSQLPLYIATLSFLFSIVALGFGWLLARREINRALIEAGLL